MEKEQVALKQDDGADTDASAQTNYDPTTYYDPRFYDKNGNTYFAFNMQGLLFWNYYITYLSLFSHLVIHIVALDMWCNYSKVAMLYTVMVFCLHAYSWAIPDRRYAAWVMRNRTWFYTMATLNIIAYGIGIFGGLYLYQKSSSGMLQFTGVCCFTYTVMTQTLMMIMFAVNFYTLDSRF